MLINMKTCENEVFEICDFNQNLFIDMFLTDSMMESLSEDELHQMILDRIIANIYMVKNDPDKLDKFIKSTALYQSSLSNPNYEGDLNRLYMSFSIKPLIRTYPYKERL